MCVGNLSENMQLDTFLKALWKDFRTLGRWLLMFCKVHQLFLVDRIQLCYAIGIDFNWTQGRSSVLPRVARCRLILGIIVSRGRKFLSEAARSMGIFEMLDKKCSPEWNSWLNHVKSRVAEEGGPKDTPQIIYHQRQCSQIKTTKEKASKYPEMWMRMQLVQCVLASPHAESVWLFTASVPVGGSTWMVKSPSINGD